MSNLATTKQVRKVMREFGCERIWTNCYDAHSDTRHVKCYAVFPTAVLMRELAELSGDENVWMTEGNPLYYYSRPAIIVRCRLEK